VNGSEAHPLFKLLKSEKKGLLGSESIKWNFTKFLVGEDGSILKRYAPQDTPEKIGEDLASILK
jgi:glutathione peroxidase